MATLGTLVPLPLDTPWYQRFMQLLNQYARDCGTCLAFSGIFEDIINNSGQASDNFVYMYNEMFCNVVDELDSFGYNETHMNIAIGKFNDELDDLFFRFKLHYQPTLCVYDVADDNEEGHINVRVVGTYPTCLMLELEGAKHAAFQSLPPGFCPNQPYGLIRPPSAAT